jgi:hypothetical protein
MPMKKMIILVAREFIFWTLLTLWVQNFGKGQILSLGEASADIKNLLIYNLDRI